MKKLLLSLLLITAVSSAAFSSVKNSGRIININPSVRAAAMGYAYTANTVNDAFGIFSNPAYAAPSPMLGFSYSTVFNDGKNFSEESYGSFAFLYPGLFLETNLGIAVVCSLEGNTENEQDAAVYLNLSRQIGFLNIGANAKYVNSKFYRETDYDFMTADAGISAVFGKFTFGAAGYNLFGEFKDFRGKKINPSLSAGAAVDFNIKDLIFETEAGFVQKNINENKINPRAGLELFYRFAALRCGYEYDKDLKDKGLFFAGFGLDIKDIIFDYAFIPGQNGSDDGDIHMAAFSYRFPALKADNEQYKQQIKYEKQQAKLDKKIKKQQKKVERVMIKEEGIDAELLKQKKAKTAGGALQHAGYNDYEQEFFAVFTPEDEDIEKYAETEENDFASDVYSPALKRSEAPSKAPKEKQAKTKTYTSKKIKTVSKKDQIVEKNDPEKADFKVTSKEMMKQAELEAKKAKLEASKAKINVKDRDFDAAKYIIENPDKESSVKQHYEQPTKTSKDDFDAAEYLREMERRNSY
ncbi:MAG: hypothetical protein FWG57_01830 [Endomicrobia bacterium]|nr:hypothetical protein [Endomicrobiia bacterium]